MFKFLIPRRKPSTSSYRRLLSAIACLSVVALTACVSPTHDGVGYYGSRTVYHRQPNTYYAQPYFGPRYYHYYDYYDDYYGPRYRADSRYYKEMRKRYYEAEERRITEHNLRQAARIMEAQRQGRTPPAYEPPAMPSAAIRPPSPSPALRQPPATRPSPMHRYGIN